MPKRRKDYMAQSPPIAQKRALFSEMIPFLTNLPRLMLFDKIIR